MNAKEFYEFQLNDKTSVVGRQDKDEIIMLMEEYHKYKVKNCNTTAVSKSDGLWDGALLLAFRDHLSKKYDKGSAFMLNDITDFLSQQ